MAVMKREEEVATGMYIMHAIRLREEEIAEAWTVREELRMIQIVICITVYRNAYYYLW